MAGARNARRRDSEIRPLMILLTDGAGNVSMTGMPAMEESARLAELFDQASLRSIVINMEHAAFSIAGWRKAGRRARRHVATCPIRADTLFVHRAPRDRSCVPDA